MIGFLKGIIRYVYYRSEQLFYRNKLGSLGKNWRKHVFVTLINPKSIYFGDNIEVRKGAIIQAVTNYSGINFNPKIIIGNGTYIGRQNYLAAINKIFVGENVLFAANVYVTDHDHGYKDVMTTIASQPLCSKGPVIIEDECWLGYGCVILSGVHIGKHSVVAAKAVVTKDVPPYSIVAGNPAKVLKRYNVKNNRWE
ncbi:acyltransferase [Prevotella sp.]|uniref:acyltransferase n=1 Tax=Prevotella sp. TaxID=59823 RepID=UPI002647EDB7|nr:acyltransferase [Prevotella sp.]MDN5554335.1 acyltransferase [Prevotella sp.]